jgi:hypothetical protein
MKGLENSTYLLLYIISNIVALLMWVIAWRSARLGRLLFFLLFAWASWMNWTTAIHSPQSYMEYADLSLLNVYKQFIRGWFSQHILLSVGFIASCQALIAISLLMKGWILKTGIVAAIIFLIAIVPLGVGSGFPCTVMLAFGMYVLFHKPAQDYLWVKPATGEAR